MSTSIKTDVITLPSRLVKRDGNEVAFDKSRIEQALRKAGQATGEYDAAEAQLLTHQVVKVLSHRFSHSGVADIESVQDIAEQVLISANHLDTARAYIVYREQHHKLRQDRRTLVDVSASVNEYLDRSDWRVSANANQGYSLGGLILNTSGKMVANYWLSHVYPPEIGNAHREGDIHIHDLDMLAGYCAGWSLRTLLHEGQEYHSGPRAATCAATSRRSSPPAHPGREYECRLHGADCRFPAGRHGSASNWQPSCQRY